MAKSIGRYEIREELGRGGMAAVYLAFDPKLDRTVALKLMDQQLSADPSFAARFEREAKTVAGLEHGSIVSLYDYGEADGWLYLVMRYMQGGTLKEQIAKGPLKANQTYDVVRRIGSALDKAHSRGVVHRDLKPANILLDGEGEPYLSDFGIVQVAKGDTEYLTQTGQTLGTFAYMSPEQVMGQKLDGRSDLYALGIILYEMLTGKHPFGASATTSGAMAVAHTQQAVPNVLEENPAVPAAFVAIIEKAMAKDPNDRYSSGREMAAAIYEALTGKPAPTARPAAATTVTTAAAVPVDETKAGEPVVGQPVAQEPAGQPRVPPSQKPPARPPSQPPAAEPVSQPAPQPAAEEKRKTPVWIFAIASVAAIACIAIAAVVGIPLITGNGNDNDNDNTNRPTRIVEENDNTNQSNENDGGAANTNDDVPVNDAPAEAEALYEEAQNSMFENGDPDTAIAQVNKAIELAPNAAQFYYFRAEILSGWYQEYDAALDDMNKAIELQPAYYDNYAARGNIYSAMGFLDSAAADVRRATELKPDDGYLYANLAHLHVRLGNQEEARDNYQMAIQVDPGNLDFYTAFASAITGEGLGRSSEAVEILTRCLNAVREKAYWCHWDRAQIYASLGLPDQAAADFEDFLAGASAADCPECQQQAQDYLSNR